MTTPETRPTVRRVALAGVTLLLSLPFLGACGFDAATNQVNTISSGVNDRSGDIDVLGAVIVADAPDSGLFEATLVNNLLDAGDGDALVSLDPGDSTADVSTVGTLAPIGVPARSSVSLFSSEQGVAVSGTFGVGDFVTITLGFRSGQSTTMTIPVVRPCYQYAGITSTTSPEATVFPSLASPPSPTVGTSEDSADGSNDDAYSCTPATRSSLPASPEPQVPGGTASSTPTPQ